MLKFERCKALAVLFIIAGMLFGGWFLIQSVAARPTLFPMQGPHVSDMQPDEIIRQVENFAGEAVFVPMRSIAHFMLWGDFTFKDATIALMWETHRHVYYNQFRISQPDDGFFLTQPQRAELSRPFHYQLEDMLYAIKYLPYEYIRGLFGHPLDKYGITYRILFAPHGWPDENEFPTISYGRNGIVEEISGCDVRFLILTLQQCTENPYQWIGDGGMVTMIFGLEH